MRISELKGGCCSLDGSEVSGVVRCRPMMRKSCPEKAELRQLPLSASKRISSSGGRPPSAADYSHRPQKLSRTPICPRSPNTLTPEERPQYTPRIPEHLGGGRGPLLGAWIRASRIRCLVAAALTVTLATALRAGRFSNRLSSWDRALSFLLRCRLRTDRPSDSFLAIQGKPDRCPRPL